MAYNIETKCIHLENDKQACDKSGAISYPIYQTATFAHLGLGKSTGYDYTRLQNPTKQHVEDVVADLEGGVGSISCSSGMAAIATTMELFKPGDSIIVDEDLYGGTVRLFLNISEKNGLEIIRVDLHRDDVRKYIKENTKAIFFETPTNPMMNVIDIEEITKIAKENDLLTIVDNTFLSPYLQNPIKLGADLVIHSGTKYLGGHNDVLAGFVVASTQELLEKLQYIVNTIGPCLSPLDSWLVLRGIKTLAIRVERAQENALALAKWLKGRGEVTRVIYPGLEEHPGHEIMKKQARGFGAMLTFEVKDKVLVKKVIENLSVIQYAESLGGVESLITYPITQTHADVPPEMLAKNGITDRVLRLSVGIENVNDLIADFERAFNA